MRVLQYPIDREHAGCSVREYARRVLELSAHFLTRQKQTENGILKNGSPCFTTELLREGDLLEFVLPVENAGYEAVPGALSVLLENEDFLVVNKPPGMPVHPSPGHDRDSLLNAVAWHYRETGQSHLIRPLYRLDKDTSGVLILAKHLAAASARIEKRYFAVCEGSLSGAGTIDIPIGLQAGSRIVRECGAGERAVTHWKALAGNGRHTFLSLSLETGRTHQIRAHLSHFGHPLAGDDLYGGSREQIGRQALHCGKAFLTCRALNIRQIFTAELPADFQAAFPWLCTLNHFDFDEEEFLCQLV